jgi:hypothetical protein
MPKPWGEKLVIFREFKDEILRTKVLKNDKKKLNEKHQRKDGLLCHSAAGEESPVFIEFLTRRII